MKIDTIKIIGDSPVSFPLYGVNSRSPFALKVADGLTATEVVVSYEDTTEEGGIRGNRRAVNRQIIMRVGLQPAWNVGQTSEELRELLSGLLTTKYDAPVSVQLLQNGSVLGVARGDVSKLEASLFTKDPEVVITIDCDYPYFLAPAELTQTPSRTLSEGQTILGVTNPGNAYAGFKIQLTLQSAPVDNLILSDMAASDGKFMNFGKKWSAGDTLIVDTRARQRLVKKIKAGTTAEISALNDLTAASSWLRLHRGNNQLRLNVTAFDWYDVPFAHTPAYVGV